LDGLTETVEGLPVLAVTVTVAVAVAGVPLLGVTVKVYVVVVVGLTVTAVPLIAAMLPGVIIPEPPLNVGIKLELAPAVIVDGVAVKPLIRGGGPVLVSELLPQPVKPKNATLTNTANITEVIFRFMKASICLTELKERTARSWADPNWQRPWGTVHFQRRALSVSMIFGREVLAHSRSLCARATWS
jgi:hypothetical protein